MYLARVTKDEIIAQQAKEIAVLKFELGQLKKLIFGSKHERFVPSATANQASLFGSAENGPTIVTPETEKVSYTRQKGKKQHPGRHAIPEHLPVKEVIIEPQEDTKQLTKIGEERTETLEYTPASLVKKITIRPKYAKPEGEGVLIGELPERPITKGIPEASLLAHILCSKFIDHLPFYRQIQRFKRNYDWEVRSSTMSDWFLSCFDLLQPLYTHMLGQVLARGYLQADESPIKVLDADKPGATHRGYQWVYHSPEENIVVFRYRKGRGQHGPKETLADYKGWLQCDGYTVYDKIGAKPGIKLAGCWAHARRKFHEAKDSDPHRSDFALAIIQKIYLQESQLKGLPPHQRMEVRQGKTLALTKQFKDWLDEEGVKVLPKSPMGKAMTYAQNQWPKLKAVFEDGRLEIDNNLIENKIRPLALGRKNYLFAGSHRAAQGIAMFYTFFGTCKAREVNPYEWLKHTLEQIKSTKLSQIGTLVPGER